MNASRDLRATPVRGRSSALASTSKLTEARVREIVREEMRPKGPTLYCSFCGKSQHDVLVLIAGPVVFICDECVELCVAIVNEKRREREADALEAPLTDSGANL